MARKKKSSPEWVERLLDFREEIDPEDYKHYWRELNELRDDPEKWDEKGREIIRELEGSEHATFRASDFGGSIKQAKFAAQLYQSDEGGRIIRRNTSGQFSKRGSVFQVIPITPSEIISKIKIKKGG